jgi:hypothetical protein
LISCYQYICSAAVPCGHQAPPWDCNHRPPSLTRRRPQTFAYKQAGYTKTTPLGTLSVAYQLQLKIKKNYRSIQLRTW